MNREEERVGIAVGLDFLHVQHVSRARALVPDGLPGAAPKVRLAGLDGPSQRLPVHVRDHQDGACCQVLGDRDDQAAVVEGEAGRIGRVHIRTGMPWLARYSSTPFASTTIRDASR